MNNYSCFDLTSQIFTRHKEHRQRQSTDETRESIYDFCDRREWEAYGDPGNNGVTKWKNTDRLITKDNNIGWMMMNKTNLTKKVTD